MSIITPFSRGFNYTPPNYTILILHIMLYSCILPLPSVFLLIGWVLISSKFAVLRSVPAQCKCVSSLKHWANITFLSLVQLAKNFPLIGKHQHGVFQEQLVTGRSVLRCRVWIVPGGFDPSNTGLQVF